MREKFFYSLDLLGNVISNKEFYLKFDESSIRNINILYNDIQGMKKQVSMVTEGYELDTEYDFNSKFRDKFYKKTENIIKSLYKLYDMSVQQGQRAYFPSTIKVVSENLKEVMDSYLLNN